MSEKSKVTDEIPTPAAIGLSVFIIGLSVVVGVATDTLLIASISFGINWLEFFVYAWPFRSEKYNDLTGTISCIAVDIFALLYYEGTLTNIRSIITFLMPILWTLKLGMCLWYDNNIISKMN